MKTPRRYYVIKYMNKHNNTITSDEIKSIFGYKDFGKIMREIYAQCCYYDKHSTMKTTTVNENGHKYKRYELIRI